MPHVNVKMYPGSSDAQKRQLTDRIVSAVIDTIGVSETVVSVAIEEVSAEQWPDQVYRPEITDKADVLTKKPGYDPFS